MDLNTVTAVFRPTEKEHLDAWLPGDAWLAGGTWLFSEPQPAVERLIDLEGLGWPSIEVTETHLSIAATCRIAELRALTGPPDWAALPLVAQCCDAFLSSFKIWNAATVGGNICMSLPAGPMISLATALQAVCRIWRRSGEEQHVGIEQFVTGVQSNILQPGDLLRAVEVPLPALRAATAFRQASLTHLGRSAALLIGTLGGEEDSFMLTVSAATVRPVRLEFAAVPSRQELQSRLNQDTSDSMYLDDVHGEPAYRKHLTYLFAEEIRQELAGGAA
jgi:CO/xanthine dehydrogenase FAD-binding subunit